MPKNCSRQGSCKTGDAVITTAGNLPAKYVIHTVGPVWSGGHKDEEYKLANCYSNSLKLAAEHSCVTIAFPAISTGVYHFPKDKAAKIAVRTIANFLATDTQIEKVLLVCFDEESEGYLKAELNAGI